MSIVDHDLRLYTGWQRNEISLTDFYETFNANVDVINSHGGNTGYHPTIYDTTLKEICQSTGDDYDFPSSSRKESAMTKACEKYLACLFVRVCDNKKTKELKTS